MRPKVAGGANQPPSPPPPGEPLLLPLRYAAVSRQGVGRQNNEDTALAVDPSAEVPEVRCLLAVADGVGGHEGGEVASSAAVRALQRALRQVVEQRRPDGRVAWRAVVEWLVAHANDQVHEAVAAVSDGESGGTTLTLALVEGNTAHIGHVGDSRFVLVRDGSARILTRADTAVAAAVQAGRMTPAEAEVSPRRHELIQALGFRPRLSVQTLSLDLFAGDRLLLCSDGLHGAVTPEQMAGHILPEPEATCRALADLAVAQGGRDDVSVVLLEVVADEPAPSRSRLGAWLAALWTRRR